MRREIEGPSPYLPSLPGLGQGWDEGTRKGRSHDAVRGRQPCGEPGSGTDTVTFDFESLVDWARLLK